MPLSHFGPDYLLADRLTHGTPVGQYLVRRIPKCPKYFDLGVPMVRREASPFVSAAPTALPVAPAAVPSTVAAPVRFPWSMASLIFAPPIAAVVSGCCKCSSSGRSS